MISINLSSIQKLASAILRQIHPRVSNFDRNHAVAPIRNRYILAVATPARETSGTSTVELGACASPNIHRPAQATLPHRNLSRTGNIHRKAHEIRSLDFECQHAMFQKFGKTWLGLTGDLPFAACAAIA
jgi:hypothetical protein